MMTQLEKEEIIREEEKLFAVRTWLSAAQPEQDHDEARSKRPMHLGDWLLQHAKFIQWRSPERSSILWLYGLPGTGKTNLSWRVINELKTQTSKLDGKQINVGQYGYSTTFGGVTSTAQDVERTSPDTTPADGDKDLDLHAAASPIQCGDHAFNSTDTPDSGIFPFFYCSNDTAERGRKEVVSRADPEEILRSIVSQLATSRHDRSIAPALVAKYTDLGPASDKQRILNYNDCVDIILAIAVDVRINIVIDALDECDHGKCLQLIDKLKEIIYRTSENASLNPMKIFIATRSFTAIEDELTPDHSLEVTTENNCEDVRKFIDVTLEQRSKDLLSGTASTQLKSDIRDTLSSRAQNMFLYASLLLNQLCDRHHYDDEESVRRKLDQLPKNLTDVYDRVVTEIHDDKNNSPRLSHIAQNTFKWLLQAQESLDCDSMLEAISPIGGKAKADEVIRSCRTLVVNEKSKFNFAHHSIREYLETKAEYSPGLCHLVATQSCLRILNTSFELEESGRQPSDAEKALGTYASIYWPVHHEKIRLDDADERWDSINIMLRKFLLQGHGRTNRYTDWLSRARALVQEAGDNKILLSKLDSLQANPPSALFAACVFGFPDIVGKFGRDLHGLNRCNTAGQSALCLAIENKKMGTVKSLLSRRYPADVNLLNMKAVEQFEDLDPDSKPAIIHYASPLQVAAAYGFSEIAEYLLEKGAHLDLVAGYYGNALQVASLNGHEGMVSLLLSRGAEPNSQGGYHGNALHAAAAQGHIGVINLLLENKRPALVSTPGGPFGSALMAAVCSGNSETIWVLLDEGADPNAKVRGKYDYPLAQAARMGYKDVVSLLLIAHAKANLAPRETPLHVIHHAALHGMKDLVEYCLEEGCDVDMATVDGPKYLTGPVLENPGTLTPLALACAEGQTEMVSLLIRRGASLDVGDQSSGALWVAVGRGQQDVVHLILQAYKEKHAPESVSDFVSRCPPKTNHPMLFVAVIGGSKAVVRELLDSRAQFDNNSFGASPLFATATFNKPQIAEMLLAYSRQGKLNGNLSINAQGRSKLEVQNSPSALFEACTRGHNDVARVLLDYGADWSIRDDWEMTVLHKTVDEGDSNVFMAYLLEKAYNGSSASQFDEFLNAKNVRSGTALIMAALKGRSLCVALLLKYGADWSLASDVEVTALHVSCWMGQETELALLLNVARKAERSRFESFLNHRNDQGKTALLDAIETDRPPFVKQLLEHGADYAVAKFNGETALHVGSFRGFESAIERVLERTSLDTDQARVTSFLNARNDKGKTALMDAAETDRSSIIQLLLKHGADYTVQDNSGFTGLHHGASRDNRASVECLLEHAQKDADVKRFHDFLLARDKEGRTAWMHACERNDGRIKEKLKAAWVDIQ